MSFAPRTVFAGTVLLACLSASACLAADWSPPEVRLPQPLRHPVIACTEAERARLRAAWQSTGPDRRAVDGVVRRADAALKEDLAFPPRGGQHNQWYQCDACQVALKTVDATHHTCPKCGKVYSGPPYDDVLYERHHYRNLKHLHAAAWAWTLTGKKEYADLARRILLGYADRYRAYPYHDSRCRTGKKASRSGGHLFEQTLNEASAMARQIAPAYDLVHDALSPEERRRVRDGLLLPMLRNIDKHKGGKSNWQTWHNAGMLWGGAVLGDADWVRKAVAQGANGFAYQMEAGVTADGMWYENSWGYHFYTLSAMVKIAEGGRRLGLDLWSHPNLRKMFTLPIRYAMADGSLPRFGDDVHSTLASMRYRVAPAVAAYDDERLAALLPERPIWDTVMRGLEPGRAAAAVPAGSEVFRGAGHAILRTRGEAGLTAAMTFGPYGGFHGHLDKLSFVFFGWGRELAVDPGRARSQAYRLPIHRQWYKATVGHNTVLVDGASQEPAAGRLLAFAATDTHAAAVAACDAAYDGVRHVRALCLAPAYLLVVDRLEAEAPHAFTWTYHNRGASVQCAAAAKPAGAAVPSDGVPPWWPYLKHVRAGMTDEAVRAAFAGKDVTTHLVSGAAEGTDALTADGPCASVEDHVPLVMLTRRAKAARFACVLEPVPAGAAPAVTGVEVRPDGEGLRVTVRRAGGDDVLHVAADGGVRWTSGGKVVLASE
ncbi:MAG: heparinase II/III family protein [Phycisphaerae bacterium]